MRIPLLFTVGVLLVVKTAGAQTAPLRVLASGMQAVIGELRPRIEKDLGRPCDIRFDTSVAVRSLIESGQPFDATVLTTEVLNELGNAGKIDVRSVVTLGRSGIGFGVRTGAAEPDVRTPEAVKQTLLTAKSLTWVRAGASKTPIDRMIATLGIASDVQAKAVLTQSLDESLALITEGKNQMIITLISEIVPANGVKLVGPLPAQFQNYVTFSAGVNPKASFPAAAALFIKELTGLKTEAVYRAKGMEPPDLDPLRDRPGQRSVK
jgi:molybdate transport system substrate-binding protein